MEKLIDTAECLQLNGEPFLRIWCPRFGWSTWYEHTSTGWDADIGKARCDELEAAYKAMEQE